jgi:predicted CoA-substrate-specific enzyme activase
MIVVGIDVGSRHTHVYVMEIAKPKVDYVIEQIRDPNTPTPKGLLKYGLLTGTNKSEIAEQAYKEALKQVHLKRSDVARIWATGKYGKQAMFASHFIPDAIANTHGVLLKVRTAKTIIDVGANGCRVIRISQDGRVLDRAIYERGAADTGMLHEQAAKLLGMNFQEMSDSSLKSTNAIFKNSHYNVFDKTDVLSLIHQNVPKEDIARAVYDSIAAKVSSLANIVGLEDDVAIVGGMAKNAAFVQALKQATGKDIKEPHNPEFVCAFGAAVAAAAGTVDEKIGTKDSG